jgi:hypothetical protein
VYNVEQIVVRAVCAQWPMHIYGKLAMRTVDVL